MRLRWPIGSRLGPDRELQAPALDSACFPTVTVERSLRRQPSHGLPENVPADGLRSDPHQI